MPVVSLDAVFFVDTAPEVEFRDGLFHLTQQIGGMRFQRVMLPSTFTKMVRRYERALALFRNGANVIEFPSRGPEFDDVLAGGTH